MVITQLGYVKKKNGTEHIICCTCAKSNDVRNYYKIVEHKLFINGLKCSICKKSVHISAYPEDILESTLVVTKMGLIEHLENTSNNTL